MTSPESETSHVGGVAAEQDSDYEDLPPITMDGEDTVDSGNLSNLSIQRIPYTRLYEPAKSFGDPTNRWLLGNCPLRVRIVNAENRTGHHILNPYLYTIEVEHLHYKWQVKRRHTHFQNLHQQLLMFRTTLRLPLPLKKYRERRKTIAQKNRKPVPRFPRRPEALILSNEALEERKQQLELYLQNCLKIPMYRNHHEMMNFLEISPVSFVDELGHKGKEFLLMKRAGGFRRATCFTRLENFVTDITGHWRRRWLVVKDNCILYMRPKDGRIRSVMLMDQGFETKAGVSTVGVHHGVRISNKSRDLYLKCWTTRKAQELAEYLMKTAQTYGRDFTSANRYDSFAPIREDVYAQWFIDGAAHFEAVADALESAKQDILIADWWLSPHIYMRRPVIDGDNSRLDRILERKAKQGVRIYILVYKEMEIGVSINSLFTKQWLMKLHPNIKVLRHPDAARGGPLLWSHHEKLVVIDQSVAFVGGIDLCFGRWDNYEHRITDLAGMMFDNHNGNNKNFRIRNSTSPMGLKIQSLQSLQSLSTNRSDSVEPINESIKSAVVDNISDRGVRFDVVNNNVVIADTVDTVGTAAAGKQRNGSFGIQEHNVNETPPPLPQPPPYSPEVIIIGDPNNNNYNQNSTVVAVDGVVDDIDDEPTVRGNTFKLRLGSKLRTKRLQAVARFQRMKSFKFSKHDSQDSMADLRDIDITAAAAAAASDDNNKLVNDELDYAFMTPKSSAADRMAANGGLKGGSKLWFGKDYVNFIVKDFVDLHLPFTDLVDRNSTPRMPWHDLSCMVMGRAARDVARHFIERWNFTKFEKAKFNDQYPWLIPKAYPSVGDTVHKPPKYLLRACPVTVQVVRSVGHWSIGHRQTDHSILTAYIDLINSAKHYIYIENQFFISQSRSPPLDTSEVVVNPIGEALYHRIIRAFRDNETFRVFVFFPLLPAFEGEIGTSRGTSIQAITHYNYSTICRGDYSLINRLRREVGDPFRYISFYGLRNYGELHGKLATELVYVHSKLLLVDDNKAIIGSSNINDRSMLGNRDSEVAVVIADQQFDSSSTAVMNGQPYDRCGKFCGSLRRMLMREHLGLIDDDAGGRGGKDNNTTIDVRDPISDHFYTDTWMATAARNTEIYEQVFPVVPSDDVKTFGELKDYLNRPRMATTDPAEAKRLLDSQIRGHLVLIPLHFLENEDQLLPAWGTGEKLMPLTLWT
ncbi:phospholipase D1-like [Oppia nitens]|uniref:phospholipase D1-like n=1 Tax=Oppia nitens TaxID=1686743 RepID=UPI0023DBA57C|nr:phospholipase D1-like [Oppia nitens]